MLGALRALCFLALVTAEPVRVAYLHNSLPVGGVETHIVSQSVSLRCSPIQSSVLSPWDIHIYAELTRALPCDLYVV